MKSEGFKMNEMIIGFILLGILAIMTVIMIVIEQHDKVKRERFHNRCEFMITHPKCRYNAEGKVYIKE